MSTTSGATWTCGWEVLYRVPVPVPWLTTMKGPRGPAAIPQALTEFASVTWARPGMSETRLVCTKAVDGVRRSSSASSRGPKPARWREDVGVRRRGAGAEPFQFRSQEENDMILLLSRAGLRYNGKAITSARRPGAGMVPGWGGTCLAAEPPRPTSSSLPVPPIPGRRRLSPGKKLEASAPDLAIDIELWSPLEVGANAIQVFARHPDPRGQSVLVAISACRPVQEERIVSPNHIG